MKLQEYEELLRILDWIGAEDAPFALTDYAARNPDDPDSCHTWLRKQRELWCSTPMSDQEAIL